VATEDELLRLAGDGLDPWDLIWVAHYFSFFESTVAQRRAFRADLQAAGLGADPGEVGADEELTGDGYWHLWAFSHLKANRETLIDAHRRARQIAEAHGARYDEWCLMRDRDGSLHAPWVAVRARRPQ
jgi:Regulator of ribonuclease activity B